MREFLKIVKSLFFFFIFIAVLVGVGYIYRHNEMLSPSTQDATLQADIIPISTTISGRVNHVFVKNNTLVNESQVLYTLDNTKEKIAYQKALATAKKSSDTYNRYATIMSKSGGISKEDLEAAQTEKQINLANVASTKYDLDSTIIRAPRAGIISNFYVGKGQFLTSTTNTGVLIVKHSAWVQAYILESFLANIRVGQPATFKLEMYPGLKFKGVVEDIGYGITTQKSAKTLLPNINPQFNWIYLAKRFPVRIRVTSKDPFTTTPFRVGASASVTINTQTNE